MAWTEERIEILTKLWNEGLSAAQVANRLGGVTRNAVIGKVHRLGLSGRTTPQRPRLVGRTRTRTEAIRRPRNTKFPMAGHPPRGLWPADQGPRVEIPHEELVIPLEERASILTLKDTSCRWPIGDPQAPEFHFCGRDKLQPFPYCEFHARKAFQPPQMQRRRDRDEQQRAMFQALPVKLPASA